MKFKLEKQKSSIHGWGIFAKVPIEKNEKFYKIPIDKKLDKAKAGLARIGNVYIDDEKVLNFLNHSCDPNSKIDRDSFSLIALKDIKIGEEITCDYNKTELNGQKVSCNCQSENCRGYFLREI